MEFENFQHLVTALKFGMKKVPYNLRYPQRELIEVYLQLIQNTNSIYNIAELADIIYYGDQSYWGNNVYKGDPKKCEKLYEIAANLALQDNTSEHVLLNLADEFRDGGRKVSKDLKKASKLYQKAIEQFNQTWAMMSLAEILVDEGNEIENDIPRAINLFQKVIERENNIRAIGHVALILEEGVKGVKQDIQKAIELCGLMISEVGFDEAFREVISIIGDLFDEDARQPKISRAILLFERTIYSRDSVNEMFLFASILHNGRKINHRGHWNTFLTVQSDKEKAARLYNMLATYHNHTASMILLGEILVNGCNNIEKDNQRAMELFTRVLNEGINKIKHCRTAMQHTTLILCVGGDGVERDMKKAIELCHLLIDADSLSFALTGLCNIASEGLEENDERQEKLSKILTLFEKTIYERNNTQEMFKFARSLDQGYSKLGKNVKKAAEVYNVLIEDHNHHKSMRFLAKILETGALGLPKDPIKAMKLYERVINENNDVMAKYDLAVMLFLGEGEIRKDLRRAAKLCNEVLDEIDDPQVIYLLASILEFDQGMVTKDTKRSLILREWVREEGFDEWFTSMLSPFLEYEDIGTDSDMKGPIELYKILINKYGVSDAMNNLGCIIFKGTLGVEKNLKQAKQLFEKAIEVDGNEFARYNLACVVSEENKETGI